MPGALARRHKKDRETLRTKSDDWPVFAKRLKRILRDAMRLHGRRSTLEVTKYERLRGHIGLKQRGRTKRSACGGQAKRLVKRLKRHRNELFVFLYHVDVSFDNNHAERTIRNAAAMRKNSDCNRSPDGAENASDPEERLYYAANKI
jgi:hypothetical protein